MKCRRVEPPGRRLGRKTEGGYLRRVLTRGADRQRGRVKRRVKCRRVEPPGSRLSRGVHCHKSHIEEVSSQGRPYKSLAPQPQQLAFGVWFSQGLVLVTDCMLTFDFIVLSCWVILVPLPLDESVNSSFVHCNNTTRITYSTK